MQRDAKNIDLAPHNAKWFNIPISIDPLNILDISLTRYQVSPHVVRKFSFRQDIIPSWFGISKDPSCNQYSKNRKLQRDVQEKDHNKMSTEDRIESAFFRGLNETDNLICGESKLECPQAISQSSATCASYKESNWKLKCLTSIVLGSCIAFSGFILGSTATHLANSKRSSLYLSDVRLPRCEYGPRQVRSIPMAD